MQIGFIGAGNVSQAIAGYALRHGHRAVLSSRSGGAKLGGIVEALGPGASAASIQEASRAEIVVLAVPWLQVESVLADLHDWNGRILIDATNPFIQLEPTLVLADLGDRSASGIVAASAPGARVVKAFNSVYMSLFEQGPDVAGGRRVLFVSGDDDGAKGTVSSLIEQFGFATFDLGSLDYGGRLQQAGGPLAGPDILVNG